MLCEPWLQYQQFRRIERDHSKLNVHSIPALRFSSNDLGFHAVGVANGDLIVISAGTTHEQLGLLYYTYEH